MSSNLKETLARIGDEAASPPSWSTLVERHRNEQPGLLGRWWPSDDRRRLAAVVVAGAIAVSLAGAGLWFNTIANKGDESRIDTIDEPEENPTPSSLPDQDEDGDSPRSTVDDGDEALGDSPLPLGCSTGEPSGFAAISLVAAPADIDGDGLTDQVGAVDLGRDQRYLWAQLGDGTWVISQSELADHPSFSAIVPVGHDLDGDGADELLALVEGNTADRVVVFRYADCAIEPITIVGDEGVGNGAEDGFVVQARSASCEDVCNVGLVCLDNGHLMTTATSAQDMADKYGAHDWRRDEWTYIDGQLTLVESQSGTIAWVEARAAGFTNTIDCGNDEEAATTEAPAEIAAMADQLPVDVLVVAKGPIDNSGIDLNAYLYNRGEVIDLNTEQYGVVHVAGDGIHTANRVDRNPGPWLDLSGAPIACPALPDWPEASPGFGFESGYPVQQGDGTWAVVVDGETGDLGQPLELPLIDSGPWWAIPRFEVDCQSGDRRAIASTSATANPNQRLADYELFMEIEKNQDRTIYLGGGEGIMSAVSDEGRLLLDRADVWTWTLVTDESRSTSLLIYSDFEGNITAIDSSTGEQTWTTNIGDVGGRLRSFVLDDRVMFAGENGLISVVDIESGDLVVGPTLFPETIVLMAR